MQSKPNDYTSDKDDSNHQYGTINLSLTAVTGLVLGLLSTYFIAEILLRDQIHPLHWVATIGGAIWGYLLGYFIELIKRTS